MRKISLTLIIFLIIILSIILIYPNDEKQIMNTKDENKNNMLSIMVERDAGTGNYIDASNFPDTGYYLNKNLSKCINGSKISFSDGNLIVKGNKTDRCYAYFDKDELGSICRNQNMAECFIKNYKKDSSIIFHDGKCDYEGEENCELEAGDLSYRYTGGNDIVHNYVCLNNNENRECADEDLYRIIGLFQNDDGRYEMKLIKNSPYIGKDAENYTGTIGYRWSGLSTNEKNTWKDSILNTKILNVNYFQSLPSYIQNKIVMHNYITGGYNAVNVYDKYVYDAYQNEILNPDIGSYATEDDKTYEAKIALMYVSDYGYAVSKEIWATKALFHYREIDIRNNNWLYFDGYQIIEWLITRSSFKNDIAFYISADGSADNYNGNVNHYTYSVRPCFYLTSVTKLKGGNGTKEIPYRIMFE